MWGISTDRISIINPRILESCGGPDRARRECLSLPGKFGIVTRPNFVKAEALDLDMQPYVIEGEGLLARAICHECDHLDGNMYVRRWRESFTARTKTGKRSKR